MAHPELSTSQVITILNQEPGFDVDIVEVLEPGAWSSAYAFRDNGRDLVIRFSHLRDDFERDALAAGLVGQRVPVPSVTHLGQAGDLHYAVSERVGGDFLEMLPGQDFEQTLPSLFRTLDALRLADTSATRGFGTWNAEGNGMYASWPEFFEATIIDRPGERGGGWRPKLEASDTGAEAYDRDVEVLRRVLPALPHFRNVLHIDLINRNCFVRDHQISGVIDWGCAMFGDFLYEVAWFTFWSAWYPQWAQVDLLAEAQRLYGDAGADLADLHERVACYELHIGLTHQSYNAFIENWEGLADVARRTTLVADRLR